MHYYTFTIREVSLTNDFLYNNKITHSDIELHIEP